MNMRLITSLAGAAAVALLFGTPSTSMAQAMNGEKAMDGVQPAESGTAMAVTSPHGNWTLRQREEWLKNRLDKAHDDGSLDSHEYDRVRQDLHGIKKDEDSFRDSHDGQLTDNETTDLETRLDTVAAQIHWMHENSFQRPW